MDEQEIIRAIKELTCSSNIKLEHLQIIENNLGENNKQFWQQLFAKNNNVKLAFREKIYTSEMVRLLILRVLILPETKSELLPWLQEGSKQNKDIIKYFETFKEEINSLIDNNKAIFTKIRQNIYFCDFLFIELITNIEKEFNSQKNIFLFLIRRLIYPIFGKNYFASIDYIKTININHQYALGYKNRGFTYLELKKYEEAIADYSQSIEINPQYAYAYNGRGNAYYYLKKYEEAITDYSQSIEINPQYAYAYFYRAFTYFSLRKFQEAITDCTKIIEINPQDTNAYKFRALIYGWFDKYEYDE